MDIFVGNLPLTITEARLKTLFKSYGMVFDVTIPKDKNTGFMRGMAFVKMPCMNEASKAIQGLNGVEIDGKRISVRQAYAKSIYKKPFISKKWREKAEHKL